MSPQGGDIPVDGENGYKGLKVVGLSHKEDITVTEDSLELIDREKGNAKNSAHMKCDNNPTVQEESSDKIISSPTPAVEMGGENEFVKVSHLASVQVKAVPAPSVPKTKAERSDQPSRGRRRLPKRTEHNGTTLPSRGHVKILRVSGENSLHNEENLIEKIEKSPYEPGKCAEKGDSLFQEMKVLLQEDDEKDNAQAVHIFGPTNSECLVKASSLIEKSGMLYSQNWNKGSIHGVPVGIIPNHLLLMLLVPNRFAKASELLLSGLCRDLEVYESVNRGLDDWGWSEEYSLVRATKKNYKFKTNKRDCFKCAIFVARAHSCFHSFGKRKLKPRLISKLKACLDLMEAHLITPASNGHKSHTAKNGAPGISNSTANSNAKRRKKATSDNAISSSCSGSVSPNYSSSSTLPIRQAHQQQPDPSLKRKRGRPPKSILKQPLQQHSESDSVEELEDFGQSKPKRKNLQSKRTRGDLRADDSAPPSIARRLSSSPSASSSSLCQLISRFQVQYEEMGRRYAEMGSLLAEMKSSIEESRTPSEQEIRRELLDEIQRNFLDSMPKR